jgi:plastocyanin domain-containing protein
MSFDKIIVIILGILAIAFIYWFFLMKKSKAVSVIGDSVDITVLGGYSPEVITVAKNKKTTLNFTRKDESSCLEEVVLGDFHIRKMLPLNEKVSIDIMPKTSGEFTYSCGMGMFHGKIIVK